MSFKNIKDYHKAVIKITVGCVVALDPTGRILEFDSYMDKISKKDGASFIGESWLSIFVPMKNEKIFQNTKTAQPQKIVASYKNDLFVEWNFLTDNTSKNILGVGIDVTRHIELEQQLQHADRLATIGQVAAGIAHELNGPLNNILGYAQLSSKQQDLPEQVYQDLDNIIRFSLHAREVVKKVMLFSRQVPPGHEIVDLNKVIKESLYFIEPLCTKNNVEIQCNLFENLPRIIGDFSQLRQVAVNLMVNSAQAISGKKGKISISTSSEPGDHICLSIKDTGLGMSSETLEQCFMPFFTTKEIDQGTGLGLAVVHGIIKSHNGTITAESILGEGSCFRISFPWDIAKGAQSDG